MGNILEIKIGFRKGIKKSDSKLIFLNEKNDSRFLALKIGFESQTLALFKIATKYNNFLSSMCIFNQKEMLNLIGIINCNKK